MLTYLILLSTALHMQFRVLLAHRKFMPADLPRKAYKITKLCGCACVCVCVGVRVYACPFFTPELEQIQ
jgi:hypothetical protein